MLEASFWQDQNKAQKVIKEKKFEYTCVDFWKGFKISDKNNNFQYKQIIYDLNSGRVYKLFLMIFIKIKEKNYLD